MIETTIQNEHVAKTTTADRFNVTPIDYNPKAVRTMENKQSAPDWRNNPGSPSFAQERLPNKAFDSEYMTEWGREVKFLADKGIKCTYIKKTPVYNIKQYKYTKTPELFVALAEFYYQVRNERAYNRFNKAITDSVTLPVEFAKKLTESIVNEQHEETGGSVG